MIGPTLGKSIDSNTRAKIAIVQEADDHMRDHQRMSRVNHLHRAAGV